MRSLVRPAVPARHRPAPRRRPRVAAARRPAAGAAGAARSAGHRGGARRWSAGSSTTPAAEPTERTVATLVDRGGGNPLFLVELAALSATCGNELPGLAAGAHRGAHRPAPGGAAGDRRQRGRARHRRLGRRAGALRRGDGPGVPPARPRRAGGRRPARRRGSVVAVPQRSRARGRLPDAHQAGARPAPRRRRRRAGRARRLDRRRRPPRRDGRRAARRARHGRRCQPDDHRPRRAAPCTKPPPRRSRPAALANAIRAASRALDLHPRDAKVERALLLVRAEAELERRKFAEAVDRRRGGPRERAGRRRPHRRGRGPPPSRRCRPDAGRPGDGAARARRGRRPVPRGG